MVFWDIKGYFDVFDNRFHRVNEGWLKIWITYNSIIEYFDTRNTFWRQVTKLALMTAQEIMDLIPNRYPICYIDYVDAMEPGKSITATKNVTINESFFQGHFPGNPVMPGVLIIETLAQAASILILKSPEFFKKTAYLGAIHNAKFRRMVRPGDVVKLEIEMIKKRRQMGIVKAVAKVLDKKVCSAELVFVVADRQAKI